MHFRSGVGGDTKITEEAFALIKELETVQAEINLEINNLEVCLGQLDQYQQEIQQLQQQVVQVEQQLRTTMAPTYAPHDRDKAQHDQQVSLISIFFFLMFLIYCMYLKKNGGRKTEFLTVFF